MNNLTEWYKGRKIRKQPFLKRLSLPAACYLLPAACLFFSGCAGYHLGSAKPDYLKNVKTVSVPMFRNNTLVPRLENTFTTSVIQQLQQDGTFQVAAVGDGDATLMCTIDRVERAPARSVTGNVLLTSEFELNVNVRYQLLEKGTGRIIDSGRATGETSFFVGNDVQQDERQAIPIAAQQAAVRLVSELTEGF